MGELIIVHFNARVKGCFVNRDARIGGRLKEARAKLGKTQQAMADALGVRREMWARYEAGAMPGAEVMSGLASMGVDVTYILTGRRRGSDEYVPQPSVAMEYPTVYARDKAKEERYMAMGARLREARELAGLSEADFGRRAGVTADQVQAWEAGLSAPDMVQLAALMGDAADVRGVLFGEREKTSAPDLSRKEVRLLKAWRELDDSGQKALLQMISALLKR